MSRALVDAKQAVSMHKRGRSVADIAAYFGVKRPCVYGAFKRQGYETAEMIARRAATPSRSHHNLHNEALAAGRPRMPAANDGQRVERDPCFRCGVRGDIGCGCRKAAVGWCAG